MVDQELIQRVTRLPTHERLALIELLARSLNNDIEAAENMVSVASEPHNIERDSSDTLVAIQQLAASLGLRVPPDSALYQLQDIVGTNGVPSTKAEVQDVIADYLSEKYL